MARPPAPAPTPTHRYRATVRARIAITYAGLLTLTSLVLLGIVHVFMRLVPTYDLRMTPAEPALPPSSTVTPTAPPPSGSAPAEIATPAQLSLTITSTDQLLDVLLVVSVVVLVVLALVGIGVGWWVAGRLLRPLRRIRDVVQQVEAGDLGQRVGLVGPHDEISAIATSVDDMLDQLERSFAASRRFAANASHELSTPLATTRTLIDVGLAQHTDPEVRRLLENLRTTNETSISTVDALLDLARAGAGPVPLEPVDVAACVTDVVGTPADDGPVRVRVDAQPATALAHPVLLRQVVTNLVSNGVRHNLPEGGTLDVSTRTAASGETVLVVSSTGPVLAPDVVESLTEPFSRAARVRGPGGHGLGLSLVATIVDRFGGTLTLAPRDGGGLDVEVRLPGARVR